ncbi:hypothetical protein PFISCL1PPCAC_14706, partial [Pristionchus fissidentatus]
SSFLFVLLSLLLITSQYLFLNHSIISLILHPFQPCPTVPRAPNPCILVKECSLLERIGIELVFDATMNRARRHSHPDLTPRTRASRTATDATVLSLDPRDTVTEAQNLTLSLGDRPNRVISPLLSHLLLHIFHLS